MSVTAVPLQPVKRSYLVWLWIGIAAAVIAAGLLAYKAGANTTGSGLRYMVLQPGEGDHPGDDDVALVNYTARLSSGKIVDQTQGRPAPLPVSGVVPGFSEGLKLMRKGGKYRLWVPANLAYGDKAPDPALKDQPMIFDVELLEFVSQQTFQRIMQMQMMQGGGGMPGGAMPGGPGAMPGGPGGPDTSPGPPADGG